MRALVNFSGVFNLEYSAKFVDERKNNAVNHMQSCNHLQTRNKRDIYSIVLFINLILKNHKVLKFVDISVMRVKVESCWAFCILIVRCCTSQGLKIRYCWFRQQIYMFKTWLKRRLSMTCLFLGPTKPCCSSPTSSTSVMPEACTNASCHLWLLCCSIYNKSRILWTICFWRLSSCSSMTLTEKESSRLTVVYRMIKGSSLSQRAFQLWRWIASGEPGRESYYWDYKSQEPEDQEWASKRQWEGFSTILWRERWMPGMKWRWWRPTSRGWWWIHPPAIWCWWWTSGKAGAAFWLAENEVESRPRKEAKYNSKVGFEDKSATEMQNCSPIKKGGAQKRVKWSTGQSWNWKPTNFNLLKTQFVPSSQTVMRKGMFRLNILMKTRFRLYAGRPVCAKSVSLEWKGAVSPMIKWSVKL